MPEQNIYDQLEKAGFTGPDRSIEVSAREYGIFWKERVDPDTKQPEYLLYFGVSQYDNGEYSEFDWGIYPKNLDVFQEWDWVQWDRLLTFIDEKTMDEFKKEPITTQIWEIFSYYGAEEMFTLNCYPTLLETIAKVHHNK